MSKNGESKIFQTLQMISRSFFLPVSILPAAGLLLGLGASFTNPTTIETYNLGLLLGDGTILSYILGIMNEVGSAVFGNLPLIFAMAVALGMAKNEKAVAVLASALSFIIMHVTISCLLRFNGAILTDGSLGPDVLDGAVSSVLGIQTLEMGVFGGIVVGLVVAALHNRFYKIKLPVALSYFEGVRFVPIICTVSHIVVGTICYAIWPIIQSGIFAIGDLVVRSGYAGTFIFGFMERVLIPFGLHHVFYIPFWQTALGGSMMVDGILVHGAQNIFFAELSSPAVTSFSIEACRFMTGKYSFMMGGLPGAALAMYHCAKPEKKKIVGGLLLSAALTSFLTGITEPIEFTFLFIAPFLFVIHCVFAGLSFLLMHLLNIAVGTTFSCGLIDLTLYGILQGNTKTNWLLLIPIFAGYFALYYFFFKFVITKWKLQTPGREDDDQEVKLYSKADYNAAKKNAAANNVNVDEKTIDILAGLGGIENIISLDCCATRLRLEVSDAGIVDEKALKQTGSMGVIKKGNGIQVIYGPQVSVIKSQLEEYVEYLRGNPATTKGKSNALKTDMELVYAPVDGEVIQLKDVEDEAFASGMLGKGIAIAPSGGKIYAPADGVVTLVYPTKHAIGITTELGAEILIHIGINTVKLDGKYFTAHVKEGAKVKKGDLLMTIEKEKILKEGYSLVTPVLITNSGDFTEILPVGVSNTIKSGEAILSLEKAY